MQSRAKTRKRAIAVGVLRRMFLGVAVVGAFLNPTPYNLLSITIAHGATQPLVVIALWAVWGIAAVWFYRLIRQRIGVRVMLAFVAVVAVGMYLVNTQVGWFNVFSFTFWRWMAPILGGVIAAVVLSGRRWRRKRTEDTPERDALEHPDYPRLTR